MQCRCPSCCADPAPTYTERHRVECEGRFVCNLFDVARQSAYLELVAKRRGLGARDALEVAVRAAQRDLEREARHVCDLPNKEQRLAYLEVVAQRRGHQARDALAAEVQRQW